MKIKLTHEINIDNGNEKTTLLVKAKQVHKVNGECVMIDNAALYIGQSIMSINKIKKVYDTEKEQVE